MDTIFDQWKKVLQQFNDTMEKELEEVRICKQQMQFMRSDLEAYMTKCRYVRDNQRLILSAPEIIIGDVDKNGELKNNGSSHIIIRGQHVQVEGVGDGKDIAGCITHKASIIENIAVDPGPDGREEALMPTSKIVNQARNITLYSTEDTGTFATPTINAASGVFIHSDAIFDIEAATSVEGKLKLIEDQLKALEEQKKSQKTLVDGNKKAFETHLDLLEKISNLSEGLDDELQDVRINVADLIDKQEQQAANADVFINLCAEYGSAMSNYAETCRKITTLKALQSKLNDRKGKFKEEPTGALLSVKAETIDVSTYDGDNNLRVNPGAGINVKTPVLNVIAHDDTGKLIENGAIRLQAETLQLATNDVKYANEEEKTDAEIMAAGSIQMMSKAIVMASIDSEIKDGTATEKGLAKDGTILMRAENIQAGAIDKDGKAAGKLSLNAKQVEVKAIDVKREKDKPDTDDKLAAGGSVLITAEKIVAGSKAKDNKTKTMQFAAENLGMFADTTAEMQQGEGKAVLTLSGEKADLGGSAVGLLGDTDIKGNAKIVGEVKAPKVTSDQITASSAFKSPNINDTQGAGAPGSAAKPSAKLKFEDYKAE